MWLPSSGSSVKRNSSILRAPWARTTSALLYRRQYLRLRLCWSSRPARTRLTDTLASSETGTTNFRFHAFTRKEIPGHRRHQRQPRDRLTHRVWHVSSYPIPSTVWFFVMIGWVVKVPHFFLKKRNKKFGKNRR